jgi:hypothetical protein
MQLPREKTALQFAGKPAFVNIRNNYLSSVNGVLLVAGASVPELGRSSFRNLNLR